MSRKYKNKINDNMINIDYLSKDFVSLKNDLINFAKSYFPNTYADFNETSPGMMLMEMSAYVGDILSYYIDHQFKENLLPLSEERRNVMNLAHMLGYKVKSSIPSVVVLEFKQSVDDDGSGDDPRIPDYGQLMVFDKGLRVKSSTQSNVVFETLDSVDFSITGSNDLDLQPIGQDIDGLNNLWEATRSVMAVSGQTNSQNFDITNPSPFLELKLTDQNVINIVSVKDSNDRAWYEVDYLAQDKILSGSMRVNAYDGTNLPTKYHLASSIVSNRRFVTRVNSDNTTSLIFGNGLMTEKYSTNQLNTMWQDNEDINSLIQGNLPSSVNPNVTSTYNNSLGETPAHTTLIVEYRVGGGIKSNVSSNDLISITNATSKHIQGTSDKLATLSVTNKEPARGGADFESVDDIKEKTKAFFSAQNRSVTASDYEARILAMPSSYGNVAKVFVNRASDTVGSTDFLAAFDLDSSGVVDSTDATGFGDLFTDIIDGSAGQTPAITDLQIDALTNIKDWMINLGTDSSTEDLLGFKNINVYVLSYDQNKNLVKTTTAIKDNIKNYLNNYKILSDEVYIRDGVVINFGVYFAIEAHSSVNKSDVKLRCIDEIIKYFDNNSMNFNQILYTSDLENIIYNNVDGIKVIHEIYLTQNGDQLQLPTHLYATISDGTGVTTEGVPADGVSGPTSSTYGHSYITRFEQFYADYYGAGVGVILPPESSDTPGVFELKNPKNNVKGIVI